MRDRCIKAYVTDNDYKHIKLCADEADLSVSEYLRRCATRRKVSSAIDRQSISDLLKVNADLARLGNLLKLAVTEFSDETGDAAKQCIEDAQKHMNDTQDIRAILNQKIVKLHG